MAASPTIPPTTPPTIAPMLAVCDELIGSFDGFVIAESDVDKEVAVVINVLTVDWVPEK
jgi:hypothetical protein